MTKEELYLSILDNIQDGVYYVDIHRKIKFWNKGAEQITGYQADEMLGLECSESKLNHIDEFEIICASQVVRYLQRILMVLSVQKECL